MCDGDDDYQCLRDGYCNNSCLCVTTSAPQDTSDSTSPVCGSLHEEELYNVLEDSLTVQTVGMCARGTAEDVYFDATMARWSWRCVMNNRISSCTAQKRRCGDDILDDREECDRSVGTCSETEYCSAVCTCVEEEIVVEGTCGILDETTLYRRIISAEDLSDNDKDLCRSGKVKEFRYQESARAWSWICEGSVDAEVDACVVYAASCGDGDVQADEQCDDGNLGNGDGCDSYCRIDGYVYFGEPIEE